MRFKNTFATVVTATTLIGLSSVSARAASFDNTGISFDIDTEVTFEFLESHGYYSSDFGVVEVDEAGNAIDSTKTILLYEEDRGYDVVDGGQVDDFLGTAGVTVLDSVASFVFEAGKTYSLFLDSYWSGADRRFHQFGDSLYTTSDINVELGNGDQQALFEGNVFGSGAIIGWDDTGNDNDQDFNDFFVSAMAEPVESVPEPTTLLGLGLMGSLMAMSRRRGSQKS